MESSIQLIELSPLARIGLSYPAGSRYNHRYMKLRVGLIGLGDFWHQRHAPALRMLSDRFELRAVCDQVAHRPHQVAVEFGATAVDGFRVLTRREDVDVVLVLANQWYGALPVLAACEAGKAVYCAGGMDLSVEDAARIKDRVEEAGIAFMAEFPRRYAPATLRLKELIATRLGNPRLLFCHQRSVADMPGNHSTLPLAASLGQPFHRGAGRLVPVRRGSRGHPGSRA